MVQQLGLRGQRLRRSAVLMLLLAGTTACTSNLQHAGPEPQPQGRHRIGHTAAATLRASSRPGALSVTAVKSFPGGVLMVAAESSTGAGRHTTRVLLSRDRGATFSDVTPPAARAAASWSVDDLAARGSAHLWIAVWDADTTDERVFRSADGGRHWRASSAPGHDAAAGATDSLTFLDARHGWLVQQMPTGPLSALFRTVDGGAHWHVVDRRLPQVAPVVAASTTHLWQGGGFFSDTLPRSTDGGRTWQQVDIGFRRGHRTTFSSPAVLPGGLLLATSTRSSAGVVLQFYRSRDDGGTWTRLSRLGPVRARPLLDDGYVRRGQLVFATSTVWWWVSQQARPTVYRTTDAGRHWTAHRLPIASARAGTSLSQIATSGRRHAWVTVVRRGTARLLATDDGGSSWTVVRLDLRFRPRA